MTPGQEQAIEELREIEAASDGLIEVVRTEEIDDGPVVVDLSLFCGHLQRRANGLPIRRRERFLIFILSDFPFSIPILKSRHLRFAGYPHVQWGRQCCLYVSSSTEWNPRDGMFGFICRLEEWLSAGARDELDPMGAPLHPPVAYPAAGDVPLIIPRVNAPVFDASFWVGFVRLEQRESRLDVLDWIELGDEAPQTPVALAFLLQKPMDFEYPTSVGKLLKHLQDRSVPISFQLRAIRLAALMNGSDFPLYVCVGTPLRGIRGSSDLKQHLAFWRVTADIVQELRESLRVSESESLEFSEELKDSICDWAGKAKADWCPVSEDRPEVTVRRDEGSSVTRAFAGKTIELWGCGALGSHIAEWLVRAGARKLVLRDNKRVTRGLLVRQLFDDADVGRPKAEVLKERLRRIGIDPKLEVTANVADIVQTPISKDMSDGEVDCLIDTTASSLVSAKHEAIWKAQDAIRIPTIALAVGHQAQNCCVLTICPEHPGGIDDVRLAAQVELANREASKHFLDEFWPLDQRHEVFQPEPGCSESTFRGSAVEMAQLAGWMMMQSANDLLEGGAAGAAAHFCSVAAGLDTNAREQHVALDSDLRVPENLSGYEVRITPSVVKEMQGWALSAERTHGIGVETGGVLFGQRDDTAKVVWVKEVVGPPPDSILSKEEFVCGVAGVEEAIEEKRTRTRGALQYIGMWHTHPVSPPVPSPRDREGMKRLLGVPRAGSRKSLLVIVGTLAGDRADARKVLGCYLFSRNSLSAVQSADDHL